MDTPWATGLADWWDSLSPSARLLWASLVFVAALLFGALLITLADRWRRRPPEEESATANDQLAQFRSLYERGELSPEEYERIRNKLGGRLRQELDVQTPPPEAPPKAPEPPGPAEPPAPAP